MATLMSPRKITRYIDRYGYAYSWKRCWNLIRVLASMGVSWIFKRPVVWGQPFVMMLEPSSLCNLKCPLCPAGNGQLTRARGNMDIDDYKLLIDQVGDYLVLLMLWNQGEPFINKYFTEMVHYAHQKHIVTVTSTNGHFIRNKKQAQAIVESHLDEIIVSLDGVNQNTYEKYRIGGEIELVFQGVKLLVQAKKDLGAWHPLINLQFLLFKHNEHDLAQIDRIAEELKVDKLLVKTAQVYTSDEAETFLPDNANHRRYQKTDDNTLIVKGQPNRGCKVLWYSSMVNWNGSVVPCCFDKNGDFQMGHAFNGTNFCSLWKSQTYMDFRHRLLLDRMDVEMCTNCSEGYKGMFSLVKEMRDG